MNTSNFEIISIAVGHHLSVSAVAACWLVENSWNVHKDGNEPAEQLVYDIELRLAEYSSSHLKLTERELRSEFQSLVKNHLLQEAQG